LAYLIGHNDIDEQRENLFAIGIADALLTARGPREAYFVSGTLPVYPFPGIHYAYALIADLAGTSTIFVFDKMRFFWSLTSLAAVFVGVRALSGSKNIAYLGLLGSSVLVITGQFGAIPGFYWGQLAPTSHPGDVAMNVFVPTALASLLQWLSARDGARWEFLLLFTSATLVLSAVHQRELFQLLVYASCGLLLLRKRGQLIALGSSVLLLALAGLGAQWWSVRYAPGLSELIATAKTELWNDFWQLNLSTMFRPFERRVTNYEAALGWGLNGLMLAVAAVVFIVRRGSLPVRVSGLAMAGFLAVASFAMLSIPVLWLSYDELLFTPLRHVIFILYCCFWTAVGLLAGKIAGLTGTAKSIAAAVVLGLILAAAAVLFNNRLIPAQVIMLATAAAGLFASIYPCRYPCRHQVTPSNWKPARVLPSLVLIVTFASLTAVHSHSFATRLFNRPVALTAEAALSNLYANYLTGVSMGSAGGCQVRQATLLERKLTFQACTPSSEIVQWLYTRLPKHGILLVNPVGDFLAVGLLPQRLAAPVRPDLYFRNWQVAFPQFRNILQENLDSHGGIAFFASEKTPEQRYQDALALSATHVLVEPPAREAVLRVVSARPDLFRVLMDRSQWMLLVLNRAD
jgi:hypothetical protein